MSKLWGTTWRHTVGPTSDPDPTSDRVTTLDLDPTSGQDPILDAFQEDQDAFQVFAWLFLVFFLMRLDCLLVLLRLVYKKLVLEVVTL